MKRQWKHYPPEEKVAILRRHWVEGVPISNLCDELGLQPTVFYRWQKVRGVMIPAVAVPVDANLVRRKQPRALHAPCARAGFVSKH
jgi:Transposase